MSVTQPLSRLPLIEYGQAPWTVSGAAAGFGVSPAALLEHLARATPRIQAALGSRNVRLDIDADHVRAEGFAGLLRLTAGIELEVAPKFLGTADLTWREDFFAIATLTRFGRLLPAEALHARRGRQDDLATLAARALVEMVNENRRRPLRTYRRSRTIEFSGDGEVDPESLLLPAPDGFQLEHYTLTRQNSFNATIQAAATALIPDVKDAETRLCLERVARQFGAQATGPDVGRQRLLPGRSRSWQAVYDLSCDVLEGFGVRYGTGASIAPGYLLDTWRAWQDLMGMGLRLALAGILVRSQASHRLGWRSREGVGRPATVTPDFLVGSSPPVVVDAKYKGRADRGRSAIREGDLYEALAFLEAVGAARAVLLYPAIIRGATPATGPGSCHTFERIEVSSREVIGVEVEVRGISKPGGLDKLGRGLRKWFSAAGLP